MTYSITVKLVNHEHDIVHGYSTTRILVDDNRRPPNTNSHHDTTTTLHGVTTTTTPTNDMKKKQNDMDNTNDIDHHQEEDHHLLHHAHLPLLQDQCLLNKLPSSSHKHSKRVVECSLELEAPSSKEWLLELDLKLPIKQ